MASRSHALRPAELPIRYVDARVPLGIVPVCIELLRASEIAGLKRGADARVPRM